MGIPGISRAPVCPFLNSCSSQNATALAALLGDQRRHVIFWIDDKNFLTQIPSSSSRTTTSSNLPSLRFSWGRPPGLRPGLRPTPRSAFLNRPPHVRLRLYCFVGQDVILPAVGNRRSPCILRTSTKSCAHRLTSLQPRQRVSGMRDHADARPCARLLH